MKDWSRFRLDDFSFANFPRGARVLDVGCGEGEQLRQLEANGCRAVGVEPNPQLVEQLRARGLDVAEGYAEHLPFPDATFDGVVSKVVLPYADERRAIKEWSRVLRPGGRVLACYHGAGYYVYYVLRGESLALRAYGLRSLISAWWYHLTGRRLPGWMGDTIFQSRRRLARYYGEFGFRLDEAHPSPTFRGLDVFIYHELTLTTSTARNAPSHAAL